MRSHLHQQVNRKVSHFILGEEGKVGSQSAFAAAAFIGATSLAGMLLSTPNASADGSCGIPCDQEWCCGCWDGAAGGCVTGDYYCEEAPIVGNPGISCWQQP
jgi:hypothetical protein